MTDEELIYYSMQIILHSGYAKSKAMDAICAARESRFSDAENYLKEAENEFCLAHDGQMKMLVEESGGVEIKANILLTHAQDHLSMATTTKEMAEEFINVYKCINAK